MKSNSKKGNVSVNMIKKYFAAANGEKMEKQITQGTSYFFSCSGQLKNDGPCVT